MWQSPGEHFLSKLDIFMLARGLSNEHDKGLNLLGIVSWSVLGKTKSTSEKGLFENNNNNNNNTLFTHATSRSDKNSLKHVRETKTVKKKRSNYLYCARRCQVTFLGFIRRCCAGIIGSVPLLRLYCSLVRSHFCYCSQAPSTRIRIFLNPQLFLSGYENIRVHTLCDHSVFISNSPVHTYPDSLRIHWGLTKLSHQALVRPGLTQYRRGRHCFPTRLSCFCRPFWPGDNVKRLRMSSRLLA